MKHRLTIGIDGCRGGWVFAYPKNNLWKIELFDSLDKASGIINEASEICIDMPMGLPDENTGERECDARVRKLLGRPFSSSVFSIPCSRAVYASDFKEANEINKMVLGKGISIQSWNICTKIKELDQFLCGKREFISLFKECHPELALKQINGKALQYKKKTKEGAEERLAILNTVSQLSLVEIKKIVRGKGMLVDDVLDALALSLTASRFSEQGFRQAPEKPVFDSNRIPMRICY